MTPWFVLVGGINGSGKSTFAQNPDTLAALIDETPQDIEVINPDLVTTALRKERGLSLDEANLAAAQQCERQVDALIRRADRSFAIETVLSTDKYVARIGRAKRQGMNVLFVYMLLGSVEEAEHRVKLRVRKGGHDVPAAKIRARWPKTLERLPRFWSTATRSLIFFNGDTPVPLLVAERRSGFVSFLETAPEPVHSALRALRPEWL